MSSAIEVLIQYKDMALRRYKEDGFIPDKEFADALGEALLALSSVEVLRAENTALKEQKEKLHKIRIDYVKELTQLKLFWERNNENYHLMNRKEKHDFNLKSDKILYLESVIKFLEGLV